MEDGERGVTAVQPRVPGSKRRAPTVDDFTLEERDFAHRTTREITGGVDPKLQDFTQEFIDVARRNANKIYYSDGSSQFEPEVVGSSSDIPDEGVGLDIPEGTHFSNLKLILGMSIFRFENLFSLEFAVL